MSEINDKLRKLARLSFPKRRVLKIMKLRKEASTRDYYRIYMSGSFSCIAMVLNEFEKDPDIVRRILDATEVFLAYRIPTPEVYEYYQEEKVLLVKDAGHISLEMFLKTCGRKRYLQKYMQILDHLLKIHNCSVPPGLQGKSPLELKFNETKFNEEFGFFLKHSGLEASLESQRLSMLKELFAWVSDSLCKERFVLTHRDLHSRNIFVHDEDLTFIDHQDARQGPLQYDLVSLLKDSYVDLPHDIETELIAYYIESSHRVWKRTLDETSFFQGYYLCMFQRSIKAAGTFFNQVLNRNNLKYKKNIPTVLSYALNSVLKLKYDPRAMKVMEEEISKLQHGIRS